MRKINMNELTDRIESNQHQVNKSMLSNMPKERRIRTRPRDKEESEVLDLLCIQAWEKAVQSGKVKYLSERKMVL